MFLMVVLLGEDWMPLVLSAILILTPVFPHSLLLAVILIVIVKATLMASWPVLFLKAFVFHVSLIRIALEISPLVMLVDKLVLVVLLPITAVMTTVNLVLTNNARSLLPALLWLG